MVADTGRNYAMYPMLKLFEKYYGVTKGTMTTPGTMANSPKCPVNPVQGNHKQQFKLDVLAARYKKSAEIHLAEGQFYGEKHKQDVRIYSVGLGTGVWAPSTNLVEG